MGKSNIKNIFRAECSQLLGEFLILVPGLYHWGMEKYGTGLLWLRNRLGGSELQLLSGFNDGRGRGMRLASVSCWQDPVLYGSYSPRKHSFQTDTYLLATTLQENVLKSISLLPPFFFSLTSYHSNQGGDGSNAHRFLTVREQLSDSLEFLQWQNSHSCPVLCCFRTNRWLSENLGWVLQWGNIYESHFWSQRLRTVCSHDLLLPRFLDCPAECICI